MRLKVVSFLLTVVICVFVFSSCSAEYRHYHRKDYYTLSGWDCTDEEFFGSYFDAVELQMKKYITKYSLDLEEHYEYVRDENAQYITIYLYNDITTVIITLNNGRYTCSLQLFFYGSDTITWRDYDAQSPYVEFLNDMANYIAYDTITEDNRFESLYNECIDAQTYDFIEVGESDIYHYDSQVGNIGYSVGLNYDKGYYYKMMKNSNLVRMANEFYFAGLLKPLS